MATDACCDRGTDWAGEPTGKVVKVAGLDAYLAQPAEGTTSAVLMLSDIHGWTLKNARLVADKLAKHGYLTVLPDFFHGQSIEGLDRSKIMEWIGQFPDYRVMEEARGVLAELKAKHGVTHAGAVGYCWGGLYTARLAGSGDVQAGVICHGSLLKPSDVEGIAKPVTFLCSDNDRMIPTEFREEIKQILAKKDFPTGVVFYPGQEHGWTLRGDDKDPAVASAAADAFAKTVDWIKQYVK